MLGVGRKAKAGASGQKAGPGMKRLAGTGDQMGAESEDDARMVPALDPSVRAMLESRGIAVSDVLVSADGDLAGSDRFGRRTLVVTKDLLMVFTPDGEKATCDAEVRIEQVKKIRSESEVGVAFLEVETSKGPQTLIRYTPQRARRFSWIAGEIQKFLDQDKKDEKKKDGDGATKAATPSGDAAVPAAAAAEVEAEAAAKPAAEAKEASPEGKRKEPKKPLQFAESEDRGPRPCPKCGRMLEESTKVCPACLTRSKTFLRLLWLSKPYWRRLILLIVLMLLGTMVSMVPPYMSKILIDDVLMPRAHPEWLLILVASIYAMQLLGSGLGAIRECLNAELGARISSELRGMVYRHLQTLSLNYYDRQKIGNVMDRVGRDATNLQHFLVHHVDYLVIQVLQFVGVSIILLVLNWRLGLIVMVPTPLAVLTFRFVIFRLIHRWRRMWDITTRLTSFLNDSISGVRVVKAFGSEPTELQKFEVRNKDVYEYSAEVGQIEALLWPLTMLVMEIVTIMVWFFGGRSILAGEMTLGILTAYMVYVGRFVQSAQSFGFFGRMSTQAMTSAERVFEVLDEKPDVAEAEDAVAMPRIEGRIEFRDVVFGYDKLNPVIRKVSFSLDAGKMLGLVGASGAGKSTTINLIARLYDPQEGQILIDGVDIRKIRQQDLRTQVGVVLQETFLFTGTIADNIAYAKPGSSRVEVIQSAIAANAHDFIMRMPDGYDTEVGERGNKLSGGEKQRIAIARALLHNPRILILDEATSSVDTETEHQIQKGLEQLVKGRTTIAIAHRLSTLRHATHLLVLERGEKAEMGSHEELMAKEKGVYKKLVEIQTEWSRIIAYR